MAKSSSSSSKVSSGRAALNAIATQSATMGAKPAQVAASSTVKAGTSMQMQGYSPAGSSTLHPVNPSTGSVDYTKMYPTSSAGSNETVAFKKPIPGQTTLAPTSPKPWALPTVLSQSMQANYAAGSNTPLNKTSSTTTGFRNPVSGATTAVRTSPGIQGSINSQLGAIASAQGAAGGTGRINLKNAVNPSQVAASGAPSSQSEEERKKKRQSTSGVSFPKWKEANPTGSYADWRASAATPAPIGQKPEPLPLPDEIKPPEIGDISETDIQSQLNAIQQQYLNSLAPTSEEQAAQAQLDQEQAALNQGLTNVEDQPIALPFITGQQGSLERRSLARQQPLTQKVARLQSMRQSQANMAGARLGFANSALDRQATTATATQASKDKEYERQVALATKGLRYDPSTGQFSKDPSLAGAAMDPLETAKLEQGLRKEYTDSAQNFEKVRDSYSRMLAVSKDPSASGDIALIFSFMKVLDPTSVVREGEFATAANAGSVSSGIMNMYNKLLSGERLSVNRQDFLNQAANMYQAQETQQKQRIGQFTTIAKSAGVNPNNVVIDLGMAGGTPSNPQADSSQILVKGPDGKFYNMSPEDAQQALREGGTIVK